MTATATSGLPVAFTSLTAAVCSVSGNTVSLIAVGTCTVAANQAGNGTYNPAVQVAQSFTVTPAGTGGGDADIPTLPEWARDPDGPDAAGARPAPAAGRATESLFLSTLQLKGRSAMKLHPQSGSAWALAAIGLFGSLPTAHAALVIGSAGQVYSQNFDTLTTSTAASAWANGFDAGRLEPVRPEQCGHLKS